MNAVLHLRIHRWIGAAVIMAGLLGGFGGRPALAEDKVEVVRTVSPNKRYEVKESADPALALSLCTLNDRKTGKVLIDLATKYEFKNKAEDTETLWKADSSTFAFCYRFLKSGFVVVFRKDGETFQPLKLPELPPMKKDDGTVVRDTDLNITADTIYPVRWEKNGNLILEEFRIYGGGEWETTYRKVVVAVPAKGPLVIRKAERIDISMREEINR